MAETYEEISERRQESIRLMRTGESKIFGAAIENADVDDLEWLLERLDAQLDETSHHVKDPSLLKDIQERNRRYRIAVAGILGNKRTLEKRSKETKAETRANWSMFISAAAVMIALGALLVALR